MGSSRPTSTSPTYSPHPPSVIKSEDGESRDKQPLVFLVSGKLLLLPEADHHVSPNDATSPIPDRRGPGCSTTRVKPARWPRKAEAGGACPRRWLGAGWTCRSRAAKHRQGGQCQGKRTGQSCSTHPQQEQHAISPPLRQRPSLSAPPQTLPTKTHRPTPSPTGEPSQNAAEEEDRRSVVEIFPPRLIEWWLQVPRSTINAPVLLGT